MISPKISRKSISILVILILIVFLSYQFLPRIYIVLATRANFSKDKTPLAYIVPISKKFVDVTDVAQNKISYGNCELYLPWTAIKKTGTEKILALTVGKDKLMVIEKDEMINDKEGGAFNNYLHEIVTFDGYNKILCTTPDQINLGIPYKEAREKASLLINKAIFISHGKRIYRFEGKNIKGFQFGDASETNYVIVDFFDNNNNNLYHLRFFSFSQKEIDSILFSIRCGNEEERIIK
jgi:hypothetical protein